MAVVIDMEFLAGLRTLAEQFSDALAERASKARDADQYQTAEVADLAAGAFLALAELASTRLATERARLEAAVEEAEQKRDAIGKEHGDWTMIAYYHDARTEKARAALAVFDAATKGGE